MRSGLLQSALEVLYPPRCLGCGGLVDSDGALCGTCWKETPFLTGLACRTCAEPLPGAEEDEAYCDTCMRIDRPWSRGVAAMAYDGRGRDLVLALKHADRTDLAVPAGQWLARAVRPLGVEDWHIVPVPLHRWRRMRRRYNQSALIAASLARLLGRPWYPDALIRPSATISLQGLSFEERARVLDGAIVPHRRQGQALRGRNVLIVDDVMTSGSTFCAATEAAFSAGAANVCVAALARVIKAT